MATSSFDLKPKELIFLAAIMEGETLLGIEDPFDGWLAHQVEEEWEKSAPEMEKKGYISRHNDGQLAVGEDISDIIKVCCFPSGYILVNSWKKGSKSVSNCYYISNQIVEITFLKTAKRYKLKVLGKPALLIKKLSKSLQWDDLIDESHNVSMIASSSITAIRSYKKTEKAQAIAFLKEKYPDYASPDLLVEALIDPLEYTIVIFSDFKKNPIYTSGFSVLKSKSHGFKLRSFNKQGEEMFEITSCKKDVLDEEIRRIERKVVAMVGV